MPRAYTMLIDTFILGERMEKEMEYLATNMYDFVKIHFTFGSEKVRIGNGQNPVYTEAEEK